MIHGRRIRLRGMERADIPKFHEWINDPEVNDGLSIYLPMSLPDEESRFDQASHLPQAEKPLSIERRERKGWQLIGNCGFFNIAWGHRAAEFGIRIGDKSTWNQGYGTETVRLFLEYGFETLNFNRIYLRVYATNPRAIRSSEKAGFVREGILREAVYRCGKYVDIHLMSVLHSEWQPEREGQ